ncbi:RyR domain-containing protein [Nonomuraea polychroma]|uniref:RyR domain-containing protein n=1 Tax=Nonomuraea polychroma TaxID=46176 RepID=UPI003D8A5E1C
MKVVVDRVAQVCHEANRVLQIAAGEEPLPHWDDAPEWQRDSAAEGVMRALAGATPQALHEEWCKTKLAAGWTYGPVKDGDAKTHPCLVSYEALPEAQRIKDHMFHAIVRAMAAPEVAR